jgi:hypothetical protein
MKTSCNSSLSQCEKYRKTSNVDLGYLSCFQNEDIEMIEWSNMFRFVSCPYHYIKLFDQILPIHPLGSCKTDNTLNVLIMQHQRVKDALHWLKANNPLYSHVILDFNEMNSSVKDQETYITKELYS